MSRATITLAGTLMAMFVVAAFALTRISQRVGELVADTAAWVTPTTAAVHEVESAQAHTAALLRAPQVVARRASEQVLHTSQHVPVALPSRSAPVRTRACEDELRLLGSVVDAAQPERSLAAVQLPGGTMLVRVGERVGARTLLALRARQALLREADGSLCTLRAGPSGKPVARRPVAAARASKAGLLSEEELAKGIRALGPDSYAITRELLEKALGSPAQLRRIGRYRFTKKDGRVEGIRLISLPSKSPLSKLGLQKGDVIRKLNGFDLTDTGGALEALTQLRHQKQFTLAVLRGGAPRSLSYQVE